MPGPPDCKGCGQPVLTWQEQPVPGWHLACAVSHGAHQVHCRNCYDRPWNTGCMWCGRNAKPSITE